MPQALYALPWHEILLPKPSWAEKLLRPVMIYLALLVIFRLASRRELAQATLFDFLILLLISNVVQNAIIGDDNSALGAIAGVLILIALTSLLNRLTGRSRRVRWALEGKTVLLVQDGAIQEENLRRTGIVHNDLTAAIRKQGIARLAQVGYAILELDGTISVLRKEDDPTPPDCLPFEIVGQCSVAETDVIDPPAPNEGRSAT